MAVRIKQSRKSGHACDCKGFATDNLPSSDELRRPGAGMSGQVQYGLFVASFATEPKAVRRSENSEIWAPAIALLIILAVMLLWTPLLRAPALAAITYNEGWHVYLRGATAAGQALYRSATGLSIANYPVGRLTALPSLGLACLLAGAIATRFSGSRAAGWYGGLCPLVWLGVFTPIRFAMNDPQWFGMVPGLLGFYLCLRWPARAAAVAGSAMLFALAVFTTDSLIAVPVAVGLNMVFARDWRRLAVFAASCVAASAMLLAAAIAIDGHFLFEQVLRAQAVNYAGAQHMMMAYALFFPPAIIVGLAWCARNIRTPQFRLLALGWAAANAVGIALSFGNGVADSILFEALIFDAMVVAVACQALLEQRERRRGAYLLMLNAIWPVVLLPAALTSGPHEWEMLPRANLALVEEVDAVQAWQSGFHGSGAGLRSVA
jgi:hypothetical protein